MNKKEVIEKIKILSKETLISKRYSNSLNYYAKKHYGYWNKALKKAGHPIKIQQSVNSINKDKDFYYFLGLLITDGHVSYNKEKRISRVSLYTSFIEEKDLIIGLIKKIFNYNSKAHPRKTPFSKRPNYDIYINSKYLVKYLKQLGFPTGNRINSDYTNFFKNIPETFIPDFIRGIIDGDGSISNSIVRIYSGSENFLNNCKGKLDFIKIHSGKIRKEKTAYCLSISTKESIIDLFKKLNYRRPHYPRKLEHWKNNIFKYYNITSTI